MKIFAGDRSALGRFTNRAATSSTTGRSRTRSRFLALTTAAVLTIGTTAVIGAPGALADTPTGPGPVINPTPSTVTVDALPTVQIDGVVWSQAIVGNTVYVGGKFQNARPAGSAPGQNQSPRSNLLAYNLTTGNLITSFAPVVNSQVKSVTASPDGKTVYIGGSFTTVNGLSRSRVAAFSTATGALLNTFTAGPYSAVSAVVATNSTVYVGGAFTVSNGLARNNLAAYSASTGALLGWNPGADAPVKAMVMTPDSSKLIVGGSFQNVSGAPAYGLAAVDPATSAQLPWAANSTVQDAGQNAAILSLKTDGTKIYGTGYVFGAGGNLEGTFAADPDTGVITWVEDCHGDTYDNYPANGVVYTASHAHYCSPVGGYPQSTPWSTNMHHALAFTSNATGTLGHNIYGGYQDWFGTPSPSLVNWFPDFKIGSYTGQSQAAWTVTGNSQYIVMGGEFPSVNNRAQQGLVRFAVKPIAPSKMGPRLSGSVFPVSAVGQSSGAVRLSWGSNWDPDNLSLNYKVIRNGNTAAPVYQVNGDSSFWNLPTLGFKDTAVVPGTKYSYRVVATDPDGNTAMSDPVSITAPAASSTSPYATAVAADGATSYWPMDEASGTVAFDNIGFNDADEGTGVGHSGPGAVAPGTATTFDGSPTGTTGTRTAVPGPSTFSTEAWFNTTSAKGGKVIGFGNAANGTSSSYDRQTYLDNAGHLTFGVYPGGVAAVTSPGTYNDGQWHQVVSSLSAAGMVLYVDGKQVAARTDITAGQDYSGYWRVGGDNLGGWPSRGDSDYLQGSIGQVSIYPAPLTPAQVVDHYTKTGRTSPFPPAPTDAYGKSVTANNPSLYWRLNETSGTTALDTSPNDNNGTYTGGVALGAPGAGTIPGTAVTFNGTDGFVVSSQAVNAPTTYSEEAWFSTTTSSGGKIIGFGNAATGTSNSYDRHVYMQDGGTLVFGTYVNGTNTITTTASYNDGKYHHVVATQGADGMKLYVDGQLAGTNPQTQAQAYTGYWRIGGDVTWGSTSNFFAGTIDEAAIYPTALGAADVTAHYQAGGGTTANQPPAAAFTKTAAGLVASFDGSGSRDPDGTVASYAWAFGDGASGTGKTVSHTYGAAGTFKATLTVTDDKGATNAVTQDVVVSVAVPTNQPPVAAFTNTAENLVASFDGSGSTDPDGTVASYAWAFGDGASGTGKTVSHTYGAAGTFKATLTVTDDKGATNAVTQDVVVSVAAPVNVAPTAAFTSSSANLVASYDGSGSTDSDGTIASYAWTFGDGATAMGKTASHTYASAGKFTVTLTVTDNDGATDTATQVVTVTAAPPANVPPTPAFTFSVANLAASFDGSGTTDPDGTVASYAWTFGDGATATGKTVPHTYATANTYSVTLTVTDNDGATATVSKDVTVTAAPATPATVAADAFGRTNVNGLGTADTGGAWTSVGPGSWFAVNAGQAQFKMPAPGAGPTAFLNTVSATDVNARVDVSLDKAPTGGGTLFILMARRVANSDYRLTAIVKAGGVNLKLSKTVGGKETLLRNATIPGLTYAAGDVLHLRLQLSGSGTTALNGKVWTQAQTEPATWQLSATDGEATLQSPGAVGLQSYLSGSATNAPQVAAFDNLLVTTPSAQ